MNMRLRGRVEREGYGTLSTIPTRVVVPPKARHMESRPFKSSLSLCSDRHAMYEFNRMSLQELLNAVNASEATPGMQSSRASVNDSFFALLEKKLLKIS